MCSVNVWSSVCKAWQTDIGNIWSSRKTQFAYFKSKMYGKMHNVQNKKSFLEPSTYCSSYNSNSILYVHAASTFCSGAVISLFQGSKQAACRTITLIFDRL